MAAKTPRIAVWGCYAACAITLAVCIPVTYLGGLTRLHYGPDSKYAQFEPDT
jgi:hypothetical protein